MKRRKYIFCISTIDTSEGNNINALMNYEKYAWKEWLPNNNWYEHDNGSEIEVYFDDNKIVYWLPIGEKEIRWFR